MAMISFLKLKLSKFINWVAHCWWNGAKLYARSQALKEDRYQKFDYWKRGSL